jgi:hypothetical protein
MMGMFGRAAEQTSLQLAACADNTRLITLYRAGEITEPGTLVCDRCGAKTHCVQAGSIPRIDCGNCTCRKA